MIVQLASNSVGVMPIISTSNKNQNGTLGYLTFFDDVINFQKNCLYHMVVFGLLWKNFRNTLETPRSFMFIAEWSIQDIGMRIGSSYERRSNSIKI